MSEEDIAEDLLSYVDGESRVLRKMNWTSDQLEDWAITNNIEKCPNCEVWCYSHDLVPSDEPDGYCCNCRPPEEDDQ